MRKTRKLILASGMLLMMAACSNEGTVSEPGYDGHEATFSATIDSNAGTRAANSRWDAGDKIGISGTSGQTAYTNRPYYTASGSGTDFAPADGSKIYYMDDREVTFTAYYPWQSALSTAQTTDFDASAQANQKDFYYLWAQGKGSKASPAVNFVFAHSMSKIALTVKAGRDVTAEQVQNAVCSLGNILTQGTFSCTDGSVTATGNTTDMTFAGNDEAQYNTPDVTQGTTSVSYGLILPPQDFTSEHPTLSIEINTGDGTQRFTADIDLSSIPENDGKNVLTQGVQYNIIVNVNRTGLSFGDFGISPWDERNLEIDSVMQ